MQQRLALDQGRAAQHAIIRTSITTLKPIATPMNNEQPLGGIAQAPRTPWTDFPDAVIHQSIFIVQGHPHYAESNGGRVILATSLTGQAYSAN